MSAKKNKKHKKSKAKAKKLYLILAFLAVIIAVIVFLVFLFVFSNSYTFVPENSIYVSSQTPQQGDTVLVKINATYPLVSGLFDGKNLNFFRQEKYDDWSAYLGIDADMEPGSYTILADALGKTMQKEIIVGKKDFPSSKMSTPKSLQAKGYTDEKVVANIRNNDNPNIEDVLKNSNPEPYFTGAFSLPLKNIVKSGFGFGDFLDYSSYRIQHLGIDLRAGIDTKVYSVNRGKVVMTKELSNYGKTIVVDHGVGIFSMYLHMDQFDVKEGDIVKKNQIIGLSGDSGYTAGPHLHFSMRDNGTRIDPIAFINETRKTAPNNGLASLLNIFLHIFR
jgi:murein DD-endopeptidase MepM/ murein hydrolase activator NlpD